MGMNDGMFGPNDSTDPWGGLLDAYAPPQQLGSQNHPLAGLVSPSEYPTIDSSSAAAFTPPHATPRIPGMPTTPVYEPAQQLQSQGMWGNWLDNLATSLATTPMQAPNNFGGGLLQGFAKGFGTARLKNMTEREKLQKAMDDYAAKRNEANIKATQDAATARQKRLDDARTRAADREKFMFQELFKSTLKKNDDNTYTVTSKEMLPYLPGVKVGDKIPQSTYNAALNQFLDKRFPTKQATSGDIAVSPAAAKIGDAIAKGTFQPSVFSSLGRSGTLRDQIMVHLANTGVDLAGLMQDFDAEKAWLRTQNGSKFQTIRNNANTLLHTLDRAESAYNDLRRLMPATAVASFNKGQLNLLKAQSGPVGVAARRLDVLVNDVVPEIGSMIMGGNSNTDHSLELASHNLSGDWNAEQFMDAIRQARTTTKTRLGALNESVPVTRRTSGPVYKTYLKIRSAGITNLQQFEAALVKKRAMGGTLLEDLQKQGFGEDEMQDLRDRFSD
jgi:hypothetical protein